MRQFFLFFIGFIIMARSGFGQSANEIHQRCLTLDSHTDTPLLLGRDGFDLGKRNDAGSCVDLVRMEEGGLDAVFFAVFVSQGNRTPAGYLQAKQKADRILNNIENAVRENSDKVALAFSTDDAYRNAANGKKSIFLGMENGYPIGRDKSLVEEYYRRGVRYITLCHTKNNDLCDSSTDKPEHQGLSPLGEEVVDEMNRLGMMVDVSHISDQAFFDVIKRSKAPVIASHSNARAVCNHPRNLTDEMLLALKENGGVVQVCVLGAYVKTMPENPKKEAAMNALAEKYNQFQDLTDEQWQQAGKEWRAIDRKYRKRLPSVSDLVDHIDHIVQLIGIDHVGFGSDFDGGGGLSGLKDVSRLPAITAEMVRRGYSEEDLEKFWGGNFLRVFAQVEAMKTL
ncbi:MAG: membrane dipeptidase [Bacteroidales bacterium]|nr:membrane dipeptidase [Bacteroidales bacterium]